MALARRLQARLDRRLCLRPAPPGPTQLRELKETVRRMRRDAESMVLLSGDDPGGPGGGARRLAEVLDDAAAVAEETWRILVRPAAAASIEPGAAVELMYVLAELLDHVTAAYPDAGSTWPARWRHGAGSPSRCRSTAPAGTSPTGSAPGGPPWRPTRTPGGRAAGCS